MPTLAAYPRGPPTQRLEGLRGGLDPLAEATKQARPSEASDRLVTSHTSPETQRLKEKRAGELWAAKFG